MAGRFAYPDVETLPAVPHAAVVCTPAHAVPGIIAALGARGTRAAIVLTGGLSRERAADGRLLSTAMLDAARPHLLRILGPSCVGLIVPGVKLNASFAHAEALPGKVAFVTQSGALATALLDWASSSRVGFSHFVSLGDGADVDLGDVLDYLGSDPATRAILLYIESITAARKFMSAARAAARNKPIIAVKAGRTPAGAAAAARPAAESDAVYEAALARAGILRVATTMELFDAAETLARAKPLAGNRLAVLTNGGGPGVMATDAVVAGGGQLAPLSEATLRELDAVLPPAWPRANPVDISGDAPPARYAAALRVLLAAPEVDALLFLHAPTAFVASADIARACAPLVGETRRNVFTCWLGRDSVREADAIFTAAGAPTYATPEEAVQGFLQLTNYRRSQELLMQAPPSIPEEFTPDAAAARAVVAAALAAGRTLLETDEAKRLLAAYGIPVMESPCTRDPEGTAGGRQLMLGIATDPVFGPVILFGQGGIAVEVAGDRAVALPPLNMALARDLVSRTRAARLLDSYRGEPAVNRDALDLALVKLSQLAADVPEIVELVVNPLLADAAGVLALDARAHVARAAVSGQERLAIRPYPGELEEWIELDGGRILLRPIRPEDEPQHRELLDRVTPDDIRFRFFFAKREFNHAELASFTQIDYDREMAFIATAPDENGTPHTLGVARATATPDNASAEFAVLVRSDLKGRGLGRALLEKLIRYCRGRGTQELTGDVLSGNVGMLHLAARLGFRTEFAPEDPRVTRVTLELNPEGTRATRARLIRGRGERDFTNRRICIILPTWKRTTTGSSARLPATPWPSSSREGEGAGWSS